MEVLTLLKQMIEKVIGSYSDRELKRITPIVDEIESLEPKIEGLSDEELKAKTFEFKERLLKGETLNDILPEAFAVVRGLLKEYWV
jgi:preprotein translocase subunit SecA